VQHYSKFINIIANPLPVLPLYTQAWSRPDIRSLWLSFSASIVYVASLWGTSRPSSFIVSLNAIRSSPRSIASAWTRWSLRHIFQYSFLIKLRCQFNPFWPPSLGVQHQDVPSLWFLWAYPHEVLYMFYLPFRIGHNRRRIGIDQYDLVAICRSAYSLSTWIIEFCRLPIRIGPDPMISILWILHVWAIFSPLPRDIYYLLYLWFAILQDMI